MTNVQSESGAEGGLLLRADDGALYLVPLAALEAYHLLDEQRAALEAGLDAGDGDAHGFGGPYAGTFGVGQLRHGTNSVEARGEPYGVGTPLSWDKFVVLAVLHPRQGGGEDYPLLR